MSPLPPTATPQIALAPMDGVLDPAMRATLLPEGGYALAFSEFARVVDRPLPEKQLLRLAPELARAAHDPPLILQLLGSHPQAMAETAATAIALGAPGVDLNFGCPARRVNGHGGGAALLKDPKQLEAVVRAVRAVVPPGRSLSAKLRLGWADPEEAPELCRRVEAAGADFISVHGRTRAAQYRGQADWTRLGRLARQLSIPLFGNGDICDPEGAAARAAQLPRPYLMVGRGALQVPNLGRWLAGWDAGPEPPEATLARIRSYAARVQRLPKLRRPERLALSRVKQWLRMLRPAGGLWAATGPLMRVEALAELLDRLGDRVEAYSGFAGAPAGSAGVSGAFSRLRS